jgi:hypothetical protein
MEDFFDTVTKQLNQDFDHFDEQSLDSIDYLESSRHLLREQSWSHFTDASEDGSLFKRKPSK